MLYIPILLLATSMAPVAASIDKPAGLALKLPPTENPVALPGTGLASPGQTAAGL